MFIVAGCDEAGRGPLAGPVVAACVAFAPDQIIQASDSKLTSKKERENLFKQIIDKALAYSIVAVGQTRIDKFNILNASLIAMHLASERVQKKLEKRFLKKIHLHCLIDGNKEFNYLNKNPLLSLLPKNDQISSESIIKGDQKITLISASSILAKVYRDQLMERLDRHYPEYQLSAHKGYPVKLHKELILKYGRSKIHRKSFKS